MKKEQDLFIFTHLLVGKSSTEKYIMGDGRWEMGDGCWVMGEG